MLHPRPDTKTKHPRHCSIVPDSQRNRRNRRKRRNPSTLNPENEHFLPQTWMSWWHQTLQYRTSRYHSPPNFLPPARDCPKSGFSFQSKYKCTSTAICSKSSRCPEILNRPDQAICSSFSQQPILIRHFAASASPGSAASLLLTWFDCQNIGCRQGKATKGQKRKQFEKRALFV